MWWHLLPSLCPFLTARCAKLMSFSGCFHSPVWPSFLFWYLQVGNGSIILYMCWNVWDFSSGGFYSCSTNRGNRRPIFYSSYRGLNYSHSRPHLLPWFPWPHRRGKFRNFSRSCCKYAHVDHHMKLSVWRHWNNWESLWRQVQQVCTDLFFCVLCCTLLSFSAPSDDSLWAVTEAPSCKNRSSEVCFV